MPPSNRLRAQARAEKSYKGLADPGLPLDAITTAAFGHALDGHAHKLLEAIEAGADLGARGISGRTLLICAAISGNRECVETILDSGMPLIRARQIYGQGPSALHVAAEDGNFELCALLVERGAPRLSINAVGKTPLHSAASRGGRDMNGNYAACARLLATERAAWIEDNNHRTALLCALEGSAPWSVVEPIATVTDLSPFLDPNQARDNAFAKLCRSGAEEPLRAMARRKSEASEISASAQVAPSRPKSRI